MICRDAAAEQSLLRRNVEIPTAEEDQKLLKAAKRGNRKARNELILRHLPAMINFANCYHKVRRIKHMEPEDLVHVCVFGVVHAIKKYDISKAHGRFISYARFWMRNYMNKAIEEGKMYGIPTSTKFAYDRGRLNRPKTRMAIANYREMTFIDDDDKVYSTQLSPEEEAIFNEECDLAGFKRFKTASW